MSVIFELTTQYEMTGNQVTMSDILYFGNNTYQISVYPIEVE